MKRNLSIIDSRVRKQIKAWLEEGLDDQKIVCPFKGGHLLSGWSNKKAGAYCKAIFPGLRPYSPDFGCVVVCPCRQYNVSYVRKIARQIVNKKEKS